MATAAVLGAFAAAGAVMLWILPGPHTRPDYLIAGTFATLAALVVLFGVLGGIGCAAGTLMPYPSICS